MRVPVESRSLRPIILIAISIAIGVAAGIGVLPTSSARGQIPAPLVNPVFELPARVSGAAVIATALSSDGVLALGTASGHVFVKTASGRSFEPVGGEAVSHGKVVAMTISRNGTTLAGIAANGRIWAWRRGGAPLSGLLPAGDRLDPTPVDGMSLSRDGRLFALTDNSYLYIYGIVTRGTGGMTEYLLPGIFGIYYEPNPEFSSNGRSVMLSGDNGIETWNITSGRQSRAFKSCPCEDAVISADLGTAAVDVNGYVEIWNLGTSKLVSEHLAPAEITSIALDSNGSVLALGTASGFVLVYELRGKDDTPTRLRGALTRITDVTLSASGNQLLVVPEQGQSTLWSIRPE
jgi:hypothetical protein